MSIKALHRILFLALTTCSNILLAEDLPDIEVPVTTYEFGTVAEGSVVEHAFVVKNRGALNLDLQRLLPSCGCTASSIEKNLLAPGEGTKVKVAFNTRGFSGAKVKTVKLFSNDPDQPSVVLSLVGNIQKDITITPQRLEFLKLVHGEDLPQNHTVIRVQTRHGSGVKLRKVITYSKYIKIEEREIDSFETEVKIVIDPKIPVGEFRERVVLDLAGAPYRTLNIPVYAQVHASVSVEPKTISFGLLSGKEAVMRSIKINNIGSQLVAVENIDSNIPELKTEIVEVEKGKNFVLKATLSPENVAKDIKGIITIEIVPFENSTDRLESQKQKLSINVFAIVP